MEAYYGGEERSLYTDDENGITSLYPAGCVASSPDEIGLCSDGIDNDCDNSVDCADTDCMVGSETSCTDTIDNDCDDIACDFDLACQDDGCINPGGLGAGETCTADGDCCLDKCKGGGPQGKSCKE